MRVEQGGLAALAGAEEHHELVFRHVQAHVPDHLVAPVDAHIGLPHMAQGDDGGQLSMMFHAHSLLSMTRMTAARSIPTQPMTIMPTITRVMFRVSLPRWIIQPQPS